jgi:hypothetical protein
VPSWLVRPVERAGSVSEDYLHLTEDAAWAQKRQFVSKSQLINGRREFGAEQVAPHQLRTNRSPEKTKPGFDFCGFFKKKETRNQNES